MKKKESTRSAESEIEQVKNNSKNLRWKIICYFSIILFLLLVFIAFIYLINFYPNLFSRIDNLNILKISQEDENNKCRECVRRFIDGVYVKLGEENPYPLAVIIDNHVDARPSFGLSGANLVYEVEVEGNITRYLAIFANRENIAKIGPIRSIRPYFIDWVKELSALFTHSGGSPEALVKISQANILDFNEFYNGSYFWRDKNKKSPHNVFTSSNNLNKYLADKNLTEGKFLKWQFKDDKPAGTDNNPSQEIKINFKNPDFAVQWKYDIINNEYIRYLAGNIHKDRGEKDLTELTEIRVKNIIIQYNDTKVIDNELRLKISTLGSGKAIICLDGRCREGEWQKKNLSSRTRYYYSNNEEVKFNAGKIWIEIIRPKLKIIY